MWLLCFADVPSGECDVFFLGNTGHGKTLTVISGFDP